MWSSLFQDIYRFMFEKGLVKEKGKWPMTAEIWKAGLLAVGEACKAIFWFTVEETHHSMFKKRLMKGRGWMNHESWSLKGRRIPSNRGGIQSCIPRPNEGTFVSSGSAVDETIISAFSALHQAKGAETIGVNGKRFCLLWCKWKEMIGVQTEILFTVLNSVFIYLFSSSHCPTVGSCGRRNESPIWWEHRA